MVQGDETSHQCRSSFLCDHALVLEVVEGPFGQVKLGLSLEGVGRLWRECSQDCLYRSLGWLGCFFPSYWRM